MSKSSFPSISKDVLDSRLRALLGLPPLNSNSTGSAVATNQNLNKDYELKVHEGKKPNKQEAVATKKDKKVVKKPKLFKCGECEFYSAEKYYVNKHVKTAHKKPFKCAKCDFTSLEKADVLKHIQMQHLVASVPPKTPTKLFKCSDCEYTNVINDYVLNHMKTVHKLKTADNEENSKGLEISEEFFLPSNTPKKATKKITDFCPKGQIISKANSTVFI